MQNPYATWYKCHPNLRATDSKFDDMRAWCRNNLGVTGDTRIDPRWDWCYDATAKPWFVFKQKEDHLWFMLSRGEHFR